MLLKYYLIKNMNLFYINNIIFRKNNIIFFLFILLIYNIEIKIFDPKLFILFYKQIRKIKIQYLNL